jgi:diacylglycerol kinase (ATP)
MVLKTLNSFRFALKGIWLVGRYERNARVHLVGTVVAIGLSLLCALSMAEWLWILLAITLVWICETFNTAIEKLVDFVSPDRDVRAGAIKDLSAGAVLFAAILAALIGAVILGPKLLTFANLK